MCLPDFVLKDGTMIELKTYKLRKRKMKWFGIGIAIGIICLIAMATLNAPTNEKNAMAIQPIVFPKEHIVCMVSKNYTQCFDRKAWEE